VLLLLIIIFIAMEIMSINIFYLVNFFKFLINFRFGQLGDGTTIDKNNSGLVYNQGDLFGLSIYDVEIGWTFSCSISNPRCFGIWSDNSTVCNGTS
jgi:hypothetical protein